MFNLPKQALKSNNKNQKWNWELYGNKKDHQEIQWAIVCLDNLGIMPEFLERQKLPKLIQQEITNLNRPKTNKRDWISKLVN